MVYDIKLFLDEESLPGGLLRLEGEGFDKTEEADLEQYGEFGTLRMYVHRDTGLVILAEVERFREMVERAVQELRENPLPWTFSLAGIAKEKPLEDVILAVWKKYRNQKMEWEG
jgi:hypothetical protein